MSSFRAGYFLVLKYCDAANTEGGVNAISRFLMSHWAPVALANSFIYLTLCQVYTVALQQVCGEWQESKMSNYQSHRNIHTHSLKCSISTSRGRRARIKTHLKRFFLAVSKDGVPRASLHSRTLTVKPNDNSVSSGNHCAYISINTMTSIE